MAHKLFLAFAALCLWPALALAQNLPAPTLPLTGNEVIQCLQGGGYKACTPNYINAIGGAVPLTNTHIFVGNSSGVATDVALSGDATLANTGALTLATVNSNVGTCGDATHVSQVTLNAKGLTTACAPVAITGGGSVANPTGIIGLTAVNGSLTSAIRSDGAPALSQAIAPTWTDQHTWDTTTAGVAPISFANRFATNPTLTSHFDLWMGPPPSGSNCLQLCRFKYQADPGVNSIATIAIIEGSQTFGGTQTFTNAPVFTNQSGTRTALGLGTIATQNASSVAITGGTVNGTSVGATTPSSGAFTTLGASGQITSTVTTGTAPLVVASTTNIPNLNASSLAGATFAAPGPIGSGTASTGAFTTLAATGAAITGGSINSTTIGATTPSTGAFTTLSATTPLPATSGGTGQGSYAVGDVLYASTTSALSKLPDVATGNALISGGVGVAPSYGKIGLTTHVSGTLGAANGGTGVANNAASTLAISGNFGTTLTVTGTTAVTLPTTGTLATTSQLPTGANPSASVGLTAVNGSAGTFMRSDGAPALNVGISPTWSGTHTFTNAPIFTNQAGTRNNLGFLSAPLASAGDGTAYLDPATTNGTGGTSCPNFYPMLNYIGSTVCGVGFAVTKTFDNSWPYANANVIAAQASTSAASQANAVALYGAGIANSTSLMGGGAWGINTGCFTVGVSSTCISAEIDAGMLVDPVANPLAKNYGVVVVSSGYYGATAGVQLQASIPGSGAGNNRMLYGINLNGDAFANYGIYASNLHAPTGIYVAGNMATSELDLPDFRVGPTVSSGTARLQVDGSASALPKISCVATVGLGTPTSNCSTLVTGGGTGGVQIRDTSGNTVVQVGASDTFAVHGAVPIAKQAISGSRADGTALTNLLSAFNTLGLITNSTTAGGPASWTPQITFVTPGTLSVTYATQTGNYSCSNGLAYLDFQLTFTPTLGTASGTFLITNLPKAASSANGLNASGVIGTINNSFTWGASRTQLALYFNSTTTLGISAMGSTLGFSSFGPTNLTNAASHVVMGSMTYPVASC